MGGTERCGGKRRPCSGRYDVSWDTGVCRTAGGCCAGRMILKKSGFGKRDLEWQNE